MSSAEFDLSARAAWDAYRQSTFYPYFAWVYTIGRARLQPAGSRDQEAEAADSQVDDPFGLTPRERQVLELIARGATNREIGAELFMAEKTASVHVSRILSKLDVRSRTEAAAVAHRVGLV